MERRLIKVATELNVGLHTIVDFLNGKGFDIEDKPTAKVTDAMYTELQKEYQKSVDIKEKADSLVIGNRPGQVTVPPVVKRDTPPAPAVKADAPAQPEETPKEESREEKPSPSKLKVVGKINLEERLKTRMRGGESSEPAQPVPPVIENKPEPVSPPSPAPVEMPEPKPAEIQAAPKSAETTTAAPEPVEIPAPTPEPVKVAEPKAVLQEPPAQAKTVVVEQSPKPTPKPVSPPVPQPATGTPPAAPEDDVYRAEAPELRGLKILGKIELDKHSSRGRGGKKEKEKEKPKPAQTPADGNKPAAAPQSDSAADAENKRKRKRKRKKISGEENNSPNARPAPQGGGDRPQQAGQQGRQQSRPPAGPPNQQPRGQQPPRRMEPAPPASQEVSQREIEEKIKATMARLSGGGKKKRQKLRRDNRERLRGRQEERDAEMMTDKLQVTEFISVQELANMMGVPAVEVIMTCMNLGVIVSINQRLDAEVIELVASEFGYEVEFISVEEQLEDELEVKDDPADLQPRAPIVTVMGHVDHGKTSLLDYIRSANVVSGEAGGITQHIGAYEVEVGPSKKKITFLDTPGHEAFTAMRARGAKITDIAVIIVAADDSVMPQTREAISHATAAGVPIVFAINKIDKPGANPEKIKQDLAAMNYLVESWGGKYQSQDISAKTGEGIEELLEKILLEAEMLDLKANPDRIATGTVIEASLDKGRGYVTKLLVQSGTLKDGHVIVAGEYSGRVKAMFNERNKRIKAAGPSAPVLVLGLSGAPQAGERFKVTETDQEARQLAMKRAQISREQANRATKRISLEEIGRRLALGSFKELNIIVKGDVDGSVEALSDALIKLSIESVQVNTIHKAVGQITESDVLLASASDAIIVGFQVRPSANARKLAEREGVEIKLYSIIYEAIEQVKAAIEGMLEPTREETIVAQVQVRDVFKISKVGIVAGCYVEEGKIARSTHIRLIRDGIVIFPTREGANGEIESLKRFKDDVREVRAGMECGITIKNCNDIQVGDVIEGYEITMTKQKLN